MSDIETKLQSKFQHSDIEWRIQSSGENPKGIWAIIVPYITNRAIMQRLDNIFGVFGWRNEFKEWQGNSQICGISIKSGAEWITKWDGADNTKIEATKGGLSDSMKRCAVQWGIGRYLYKSKRTFALITDNGIHNSKIKIKGTDKWIKWSPPTEILFEEGGE